MNLYSRLSFIYIYIYTCVLHVCRHIINMNELKHMASFNGQVDVVILRFGEFSIPEQIAAVRELDLLMGIVGSDCNNAMFLSTEATFIQLTPYKCEIKPKRSASPGRKIRNQVIGAGVGYKDWTNNHPDNAEIPWHLWHEVQERECQGWSDKTLTSALKQEIWDSDPDGCLMWDFWQQQNTWLELSEGT